ncbi:hypothetical protein EDB19DRAFT_2043066 [Suillus lakei]|nr:hypothetical protein EDB19DRAFT_2043066 [Suillus lakei]
MVKKDFVGQGPYPAKTTPPPTTNPFLPPPAALAPMPSYGHHYLSVTFTVLRGRLETSAALLSVIGSARFSSLQVRYLPGLQRPNDSRPAAGAGIASRVSAEPLRLLVESSSNANANIRFGHALANANVNGNDDSDNVARLVRPSLVMITSTEVKGKHHFCGASLKAKALRMSNAFRHALGFPLIEMGDHDTFKGEIASNPGPVSGELHILPIPLFLT